MVLGIALVSLLLVRVGYLYHYDGRLPLRRLQTLKLPNMTTTSIFSIYASTMDETLADDQISRNTHSVSFYQILILKRNLRFPWLG